MYMYAGIKSNNREYMDGFRKAQLPDDRINLVLGQLVGLAALEGIILVIMIAYMQYRYKVPMWKIFYFCFRSNWKLMAAMGIFYFLVCGTLRYLCFLMYFVKTLIELNSCSVDHYGFDFTFQFKWLSK